jgi:glycosyltransferase involved in cell wall biosynthesis
MPKRLPIRGPWTSEELALAVRRGERFQTVAGEVTLCPPPIPEPVGLVRKIRRPLGKIRRATTRWLRSRSDQSASRRPKSLSASGDLRVLLDVQALQGPSAGRGIGRYTLNLFEALVKVRPNWTFEIVANAALPPFSARFTEGLVTHQFMPPHPEDIWTEANDWAYAEWLLGLGAQALLITDLLTPPVAVPAFRNGSFPVLAVLHDLIPLLFPEHYLNDPYYVPYYLRRLGNLLTCDGVLTNSRCTAVDFRRVFGPKCPATTNIRGAVDRRLQPHEASSLDDWRRSLREKYSVEREFLLYVGGPDHRKNLKGTVRAFANLSPEIRSGLQLVIACELEDRIRGELSDLASEQGLSDRVIVTGRVSDEELVALYQIARLFLFPSLYEGLGFPLLEALTCGAPVVCGENSSIPEYSGPHAFIAEPSDPAAFAFAIEAGLSESRDEHLADRQEFAASFTWESAAEQAAQAIARSAAGRRDARNLAS